MAPQLYDFAAPFAAQAVVVPPQAPTLSTAFTLLISFAVAIVLVTVCLAIGWHLGSRAMAREEQKLVNAVAVDDLERNNISITVSSESEVFPAEKKL